MLFIKNNDNFCRSTILSYSRLAAARRLLTCLILLSLSGCLKPQSISNEAESLSVFGQTSDTDVNGPGNVTDDQNLFSTNFSASIFVANAKITLKNASGENIKYDARQTGSVIEIKTNKQYPLILTASRGVRMLSGAAQSLDLSSVITSTPNSVNNIGLLSTFIHHTAKLLPGGLTENNVALTTEIITGELGVEFNTDEISNPLSAIIESTNISAFLLSDLVLNETLNRLSTALLINGLNRQPNTLIEKLSADLIDGKLDGIGLNQTDARISALFQIIHGKVLLQVYANLLSFDGLSVSQYIKEMQRAILPNAADINYWAADERILSEILSGIQVSQRAFPSESLSILSISLQNIKPGSTPGEMNQIFANEMSKQPFSESISRFNELKQPDISALASNQSPSISASNPEFTLSWAKSADDILGYIIYYGDSPDAIDRIAKESVTNSVNLKLQSDLNAKIGSYFCLTLRAYNKDGLSDASAPACLLVQ